MKQWKALCAGSSFLALVAAGAAQADVTALQVWEDWRSSAADAGYTLEWQNQANTDDSVTVTGLKMGMALADGTFSGTIDEVVLRETGDGKVAITVSPSYPIAIASTSVEGEKVDMAMSVTNDGLTLVAGGTPEDLTYDFTAESIGFALDSIVVDGAKVDLTATGSVAKPAGQYLIKNFAGREIASTFTADNFDIAVSAIDPETKGNVNFKATAQTLAATSNTFLPDGVVMSDLAAALTAGAKVDAKMTYGPIDYSFDVTDPQSTISGTARAENGDFTANMSKDAIAYGANTGASTVSVSGPQLPFPIDLSTTDSGFEVLMPLGPSETATPFKLLTRITDLKVSDALWNMLDPAAVLPRDPATLLIDVAGTAKMTANMMDPVAMETMAGPPGELHSVDLNALRLKIAGAELTGTGAFTFDNTDMTTFPGMPKPTGSADLMLVGGNALLDKIVQMGLIPEDQAMGARMMLGLFARPGDGPDTLVSKIEVMPDGAVMANGQRIQ